MLFGRPFHLLLLGVFNRVISNDIFKLILVLYLLVILGQIIRWIWIWAR